MGLKDDLAKEVDDILGWRFDVSDVKSIPRLRDLTLGETAHRFTTAVLYADVRNSSRMPEEHRNQTVAKVFNAFLNGAVRISKSHGGNVRSFNGDSILCFFNPDDPNPSNSAVLSALKITYFARNMLDPVVKQKYKTPFDVGIGVSYGLVFATKAGIRGDGNHDIIWPSTPTNLAAKMGDASSSPYSVMISESVYKMLPEDLKYRKKWIFKNHFWEDRRIRFAGTALDVKCTTMDREI